MTILMSKRSFLKGLFATPAIVMASSLMPIKPVAANVFTLESFKELSSFNEWCLVKENIDGHFAWMMKSEVDSFINPLNIVETHKIDDTIDPNVLTLKLMKRHSARVIHDLPSLYKKSSTIII